MMKTITDKTTIDKDFLGTGWSFPPTFSRTSLTVEMVSNDIDIHQSLIILFSTLLGERLMLPEYGTILPEMIFRVLNTTLLTQVQTIVVNAILSWEARIDVTDVNVTEDPDEFGAILVEVVYIIRRTNARSNFVYPFYKNEATIPASKP
ncbi:MAG TPA: GPW/gp25 family protein [Bryobacteraceae bacterium]|nr:GPW/gp25 family protein [Bryobacteraceae bacterium]